MSTTDGLSFFDAMHHKPKVVTTQVAAGLETVHRLSVFLSQVCKCSNTKPDTPPIEAAKTAHQLTPITAQDAMTGYVQCAQLTEGVLINSFLAQASFVHSVSTTVIAPLEEFYARNVEIKNELDKEFENKIITLANAKGKISEQRSKCFEQLCLLKQTLLEAEANDDNKSKHKRMVTKAGSLKAQTISLFQQFEQDFAFCKAQELNHTTDVLPEYLNALETIEKERMMVLQMGLEKFVSFSNAFAEKINAQAAALKSTFDSLQPQHQSTQMLSTWEKAHGLPPPYSPMNFGLACQSKDIEREEFETLELSQIFRVRIDGARGLKGVDRGGSSEPFASFSILLKKDDKDKGKVIGEGKTQFISKSLDPRWDRTFDFSNVVDLLRTMDVDGLKDIYIELEVLSHDSLGRDDYLGSVTLSCQKDIMEGDSKVRWFPLIANPKKSKEQVKGQVGLCVQIESYSYLMEKTQFQFGRPVADIKTTLVAGYTAPIPTVLEDMKNYLLSHGGLDVVGIFRLAPDGGGSDTVKRQLNLGTFEECSDVNCIANLIKVWFRDLPPEHSVLGGMNVAAMRACKDPSAAGIEVERLPSGNRALLEWLLDLCVLVSKNSEVNKMPARNLATVIGPNLITTSFSQDPSSFQHVCDFVELSILWRADPPEEG